MSQLVTTTKFSLGNLYATPGALELLESRYEDATKYLRRHVAGDWGDLSEDDIKANEEALLYGTRILSSYRLGDNRKIWIITEAADEHGRRVATTILLPEEY